MMELHQISLTVSDKAYLNKKFVNGEKLDYRAALQHLSVDVDNESRWFIQRPQK